MKEKITVFDTVYALTSGIRCVEAETCETTVGMVAILPIPGKTQFVEYRHAEGKDWHRTREGAIARATAMRDAAIIASEKRIKKLRAMTFE